MFKEAGIVEMTFDRRVRDDTLMQIKNNYHLRSFLYYIRTESTCIETIEPINQINTNIYFPRLLVNNIEDDISNIDDILLKKWHQ